MLFGKSFLVGAAAVVAAVAQTSSQIAFTSTPATVAAGSKTTLKWAGGDDGQPVTITLRQGDEDNLKTVRVITGSATGGSFTWSVPKDLPSASDYALEISQGVSDNNYSGMFTLTGGTASSSSSPSTPSTSTSPTSASAILQSAIATLNSTTTTLAAANVTTTLGSQGTGVVGTGVSGVGATGTGSPIHRNTTLSRATLSSTKSSSSSSTAAATTTGGSSGSSTTSSAPSSSSSSAAMEAAGFASPFALIFGAVAAIAYLG